MVNIASVGLHASGQKIGTTLRKPEFASLNSILSGDEFRKLPKSEPTSVDHLADQIPNIKISGPTPSGLKKTLPYPLDNPPATKPKLQHARKNPAKPKIAHRSTQNGGTRAARKKLVQPEKVPHEAPLDTPFRGYSPVELGVNILQHHHAIKTVRNSLNGKSLNSDPKFMDKLQKLARLKADQDLLRYEYYRRPELTKKQADALIESMADHYTFSPQGKRYKYPDKIAKKDL